MVVPNALDLPVRPVTPVANGATGAPGRPAGQREPNFESDEELPLSDHPEFKFRYFVQLLVSDVASAAHWYEQYLGLRMEHVCRHGERLTYATMTHADDGGFFLQNISALQELGYLPRDISFEGFEVKVKVEGLKALHEHLSARLPDLSPNIIRKGGRHEFTVRDSTGYILVFYEWDH